jgi:hypothetical protein
MHFQFGMMVISARPECFCLQKCIEGYAENHSFFYIAPLLLRQGFVVHVDISAHPECFCLQKRIEGSGRAGENKFIFLSDKIHHIKQSFQNQIQESEKRLLYPCKAIMQQLYHQQQGLQERRYWCIFCCYTELQ